jgi:hypothetical protein
MKHVHLYSIEDLQSAAQDKLRLYLIEKIDVFLQHIINCSLCKQKSLTCEICKQGPIYPFNTVKVIQCKSCSTFYHR